MTTTVWPILWKIFMTLSSKPAVNFSLISAVTSVDLPGFLLILWRSFQCLVLVPHRTSVLTDCVLFCALHCLSLGPFCFAGAAGFTLCSLLSHLGCQPTMSLLKRKTKYAKILFTWLKWVSRRLLWKPVITRQAKSPACYLTHPAHDLQLLHSSEVVKNSRSIMNLLLLSRKTTLPLGHKEVTWRDRKQNKTWPSFCKTPMYGQLC